MASISFSNIFSRKRPIALHVSDHAITLLALTPGKSVASFGRAPLPEGIVRDGIILDRTKLVYHIRELAGRTRPDAIVLDEPRDVMVGIPESRTFTHVFFFPRSTTAERDAIAQAIKEEAAKIIPLDLGELYYDWQVIPTPDERRTAVLFAGISKSVVQDYIATCEESGMTPIAVDMETIALSRALLASGVGGATAIMDIGSRTTNIGFYDEGRRINMSVSIPIAGESFTKAIMEHMHSTKEEADLMKERDGFNPNIPANHALIILQERVQAILREWNKALGYFERNFGKRIGRVVLAGGSALIPDLGEYLRVNLAREVEVGDPTLTLAKSARATLDGVKPIFLAPAIGIALRGNLPDPRIGEINLLRGWKGEQWAEREKRILTYSRKLAIPLFIAGIALFVYVMYAYIVLPRARLIEEAGGRTMLRVDRVPEAEVLPTSPPKEDVVPPSSENEAIPDENISQEEVIVPDDILPRVLIRETPTGWLNVREGAGTGFPSIGRVYPREHHVFLEEKNGWVAIEWGTGKIGWVSGEYVSIEETN